MTKHDWKIETIDGGHVGEADFWHCPDCGLSGGPVWGLNKQAPGRPFLAGHPSLTFSDDCGEARVQLAELKASPEWQARQRERMLSAARGMLANLSPRVGGKVDRKTCTVTGGDGRKQFRLEPADGEGRWKLTLRATGDVEEHEDTWTVARRLRVYFGLPEPRYGQTGV